MQKLSELENLISYKFNNQDLLIEALSHPSLKQHNARTAVVKDYERLELLGDSVINFIVTEKLYQDFTKYDEGKLAKIRSQLVCKDTLCKIAAKINLANYIIMTHGEEVSGGRNNPNNTENALEALVAAIYLDSDIHKTKEIVQLLWSDLFLEGNFIFTDPKTALQEWAQGQGYTKPLYEIIQQSGAAHSPIFTIKVTVNNCSEVAQGNSIKAAEKKAAEKLFANLTHQKE